MSENELFKAMVAVHTDLAAMPFVKDSTANAGGQGRSWSYMSLPSIVDALRPVLASHNLFVLQTPSLDRDLNTITVNTTIHHASGETLHCGVLPMVVADARPQTVGTAISYIRRYALCSIFMLAADDDDGVQSSAPPARQQPQTGQRINVEGSRTTAVSDGKLITLYRDINDVDATLWLPKGMAEAVINAAKVPAIASDKAHGFAAGVLNNCAKRFKDSIFQWDGDAELYSTRQMFELLTVGKTADKMRAGVASWIIENLHPMRGKQDAKGVPVAGNDGKQMKEDNPNYKPMWANAVESMLAEAVDYLSQPMEDE